MSSVEFAHILTKCREAQAGGWSVLSTGEKLATALALNRADWLALAGYSIVEAVDRVGPTWIGLLPAVARQLADEVST